LLNPNREIAGAILRAPRHRLIETKELILKSQQNTYKTR